MRPFFVALMAGLLASCATISIKTNIDPAYKDTLQKVAVVSNALNISISVSDGATAEVTDKPLGVYLSDTMAKEITASGIEAQSFNSTGLELDSADIEKRIQSYGPRQVIAINLISGTTVPVFFTQRLKSGLFDISVLDVASQKTVWRGSVSLNGLSDWGIPSSSFEQMIQKAVKELQTSGLLVEMKPAS